MFQLKLSTDVSMQAPVSYEKEASDKGKGTLGFIENVSAKGNTIFVYKLFLSLNVSDFYFLLYCCNVMQCKEIRGTCLA